MNNILPTPINETRIKKTLTIFMLLFCVLPAFLNIVCITPLMINLSNNVLYEDNSPILLTLKYVLDLLSVISFVSVYAIISFSKVLLKKKVTVTVSILYCALILLKIPANLLVATPFYNENKLVDYFFSLFEASMLEALQFGLILIFAIVIANSYLRSTEMLEQKIKKGKASQRIEQILPIKKYINWYNPLLRTAIYSSIIITAVRIFSRTVSLLITIPDNVMLIITDYISDLIFGFAAYIIFIFIFNLLYDKLTKPSKKNNIKKENKADENNSSALFED